ncbi:MAG TPA: hypothetical protein VEU31_01165 [Candidatus Acidoferrales bacterium]|nr:hypothetical protein [Candidatus Acidoferrales bacterium]
MLRRPDAGPGCSWMKRWDEKAGSLGGGPSQGEKPPKFLKKLWIFYWIFMVLVFAGTYFLRRTSMVWPNESHLTPHESSLRIAGLPLFASGDTPRGIVAVGARPVGVLAVGGIAVGIIAIGGVALGGVAFGGVSAGILALGGGALGWWAVGGGAVGRYAFGGLAVGDYAYAGNGVAFGRQEASGRQKERLLG